jgi:type II secretory pathway pseudopilin PulG
VAPRALTLLELLLVVAVLATVAGTLLVSSDGIEERAGQDVTRTDLVRLREAVLRFRKDTGFLPKQGPYGLLGEGPEGRVPIPVGADPAAYGAWFHSPANLDQLHRNPLLGTAEPRAWDLDRRRGWNGPYLSRTRARTVLLGDGLREDGEIDPGGGPDEPTEGARAVEVPGLADGAALPGLSLAAPLPGGVDQVFVWKALDGTPAAVEGRPLFLFGLDDPQRARCVATGPDGLYTPLPSGSVDLTAPGSDDVGVYLHQ